LYWFPCFWQPYMESWSGHSSMFCCLCHWGAFGAIVALPFSSQFDNYIFYAQIASITLIGLGCKKTPFLIVNLPRALWMRYAPDSGYAGSGALEDLRHDIMTSMAFILGVFSGDFQWSWLPWPRQTIGYLQWSGGMPPGHLLWRIFFVARACMWWLPKIAYGKKDIRQNWKPNYDPSKHENH